MLCVGHTDEVVIAFCDDCEALVCYECITNTHERHKFQKLKKVGQEKREKLLEIISDKDGIVSELQEHADRLEVSKKKSSNLEESIIQDIHDRAKEIKAHVDHIRDKQASEVRELFKTQRTSVERKGTNINEAIETVAKISRDIDTLQNKSDIEIIQLHAWLNKLLEELRNNSEVNKIEGEFVSGGEFEENVEKLFGSFVNENETASDDVDSPSSDDAKSRKLDLIDIGIKGIMESIHITGKDSGWLLSSNGILYFSSSFSKQEYKERAKGVSSFAVSKEGEIYIATTTSIIRKLNSDGTMSRWCDMEPYLPIQIYIKKAGEISVLARKTESGYILYRFDSIGRKLDSFCLKQMIKKISENEFGDFCVLENGMIKELDYNGVQFISRGSFKGVLGANPSETCRITDFCYASRGRIIVSDTGNNVIYLLDRNCSFIKLLTSVDEIISPSHVTLDTTERLWISTPTGIYILSNWDH